MFNAIGTAEKDFIFTPADFKRVVQLINEHSGISLTERKSDMVYSRLARRLRKLRFKDFDSYLAFVEKDKEEEVNFINALTTNLTHFFREIHHFDYLKKIYIPELLSNNCERIRFWSAGCSTGEEPYSLSMTWQDMSNKNRNVDFKILATDLDTNVLDACRKGIYENEKLKPVDEAYMKWFKKTHHCRDDQQEVSPVLREPVHFKPLNLMHEWPMKGPFDLIICRNVLIYFDKETQNDLVNRFSQLLTSNGCLILGHSENLSANKDTFRLIGKTIYRKKC